MTSLDGLDFGVACGTSDAAEEACCGAVEDCKVRDVFDDTGMDCDCVPRKEEEKDEGDVGAAGKGVGGTAPLG